jgi:hypothetical protein
MSTKISHDLVRVTAVSYLQGHCGGQNGHPGRICQTQLEGHSLGAALPSPSHCSQVGFLYCCLVYSTDQDWIWM